MMKNFIDKYLKEIVIATSVLVMTIGMLNLFFSFDYLTSSNDECLWEGIVLENNQPAITLRQVKENGVTWNAGLRDKDTVLSLDGRIFKSIFDAQKYINTKRSSEYVTYEYLDNGVRKTGDVYIKKLLPFGVLANVFLGNIWLLVGFVLILSKPEGFVQRLFYLTAVSIVFSSVSIYIRNIYAPPVNLAYEFIEFISGVASIFLPFLIAHFFFVFPTPFKFVQHKNFRKIYYSIPILVAIGVGVLRTIVPNLRQTNFYFNLGGAIGFISLISVFIGLVSLTIKYFKIDNKEERKPLFIILTFSTLGFLSNIYTNFVAPAIASTIFNTPEFYAPIILIVLIPISFGIAVFRYQFLDVSVVIKNGIVYGLATLAIAGTYFLTIYLIGTFISSAIGTEYQGIIAGIIFIIFALVFQSTKDKFQEFLTREFYPEQFASQRILIQFSHEVSTVVGIDKILNLMRKTFVDSLNLKVFGIMLKEDNAYKLLRGKGIIKEKLELEAGSIDAIINDRLLLEKLPLIEREDFTQAFASENLEHIYTIIPMRVKNNTVGLLLFGLKHSGSKFAGKDLELLVAAANQSAISIENARLYKIETESIKIERDLDLARKIQKNLLPKKVPQLKNLNLCGNMIPAMQVGGDYYDFLQVSPTKLFIVVGDVSGKGLSASLYMTKIQTMMQLACNAFTTPKEILIDINRKIYDTIERSWFITLNVALFDVEKMKVSFCRAGHTPILVKQNGTIITHKNKGMGIGLERGPIFESNIVEEEMDLVPGQLFTFFSDGLVEAMNEKEEFFGEERLYKILEHNGHDSVDGVMHNLWTKIDEFRGNTEQFDDMTLVLVSVTN